ncbi:DUF397 domain-containing protein [Streptomyces sp. SJ1-7]|nr:DUF397 domain-containing protein [Streptomyces sp. SJ1-7]
MIPCTGGPRRLPSRARPARQRLGESSYSGDNGGRCVETQPTPDVPGDRIAPVMRSLAVGYRP